MGASNGPPQKGFMLNETELNSHKPHRYYEALGRCHDYIMRCKDCNEIVTYHYLTHNGSCPCGNKRVAEIRGLNLREWLKIRFGIIRFPDSDKFLAEFPGFWALLTGTIKEKWASRNA